MTREIIFWAMNILGGVMGGRESAKLSHAAQKARERCCQVELLVRILIELMPRCISPESSGRPLGLRRLHGRDADWQSSLKERQNLNCMINCTAHLFHFALEKKTFA